MTLSIKKFVVRPHEVRAVQITENNMAEVAKWAKGEVRTEVVGIDGEILSGVIPEGVKTEIRTYVKARVYRYLNDRQTKGYVGDWVLKRKGQFKVYTDKAFAESYVDDPDSIPMGKYNNVVDDGSVFQSMVEEKSKPKETFLAVSGHETRFVTPPSGVPMREVEPGVLQVPNFVHKSEEPMTEAERDEYTAELAEKFGKEGFTGRVIVTEPETHAFFMEPAAQQEIHDKYETAHVLEEAAVTPKHGLFRSFIGSKPEATEE